MKTPKLVIRKVPQTVADWQDIIRYLNRTVESSELIRAIQDHEAEADPHPTYLTQTEGDVRYSSAPIGSMMLWPSPMPPIGYMIADGSAISRSTYSALYNIVGTAYGAGDGSTTFNLPSPVAIDVES
jgi:hypothetical protein